MADGDGRSHIGRIQTYQSNPFGRLAIELFNGRIAEIGNQRCMKVSVERDRALTITGELAPKTMRELAAQSRIAIP